MKLINKEGISIKNSPLIYLLYVCVGYLACASCKGMEEEKKWETYQGCTESDFQKSKQAYSPEYLGEAEKEIRPIILSTRRIEYLDENELEKGALKTYSRKKEEEKVRIEAQEKYRKDAK